MNYNYVKFLQKCFAIISFTLTLNGLAVVCISCYAMPMAVSAAAIVGHQLTLPFIVSIALGALVSVIGIAGLKREPASHHAEISFKLFITLAVIGVTVSFYVLSAMPGDVATVKRTMTTELEALFNDTDRYDEAVNVQLALGCCGVRNVTDWLKPHELHRFPKEACCIEPLDCEAPSDVALLNDTLIVNYHKDCVTVMENDVMPKLLPTMDALFGIVCFVLPTLAADIAVSLALAIGARKNTVSTVEWPKHYLNELVY